MKLNYLQLATLKMLTTPAVSHVNITPDNRRGKTNVLRVAVHDGSTCKRYILNQDGSLSPQL